MARHYLRRIEKFRVVCAKRVSFLSKNPFQRLFSAASSKMELYGAKRPEEPESLPLSERYLLKTGVNHDRGFYPRARGAPESAPKETRAKYPKLEETPEELIDRVGFKEYPQRLECLALKGLPRLGKHYPAHQFLKEERTPRHRLDFGFKDFFLKEKCFIQYWKSVKQFQYALWGLLDHIRRSPLGASVLSRRVVRSYAYGTPHRSYLPKEGYPVRPEDILSMPLRARVFQFLRKY